MNIATNITPIDTLESNAVDIVNEFAGNSETFALLKLIAMGGKEYRAERYQEADRFFAEMDEE